MTISYMQVDSPIGCLTVAATDAAVVEILFTDGTGKGKAQPNPEWVPVDDVGLGVTQQLNEYFAGDRVVFDLPLNPQGTDFQKDVWKALVKIPFGITKTYQQIAQQIERPKAVRAVGAANGRNPIPLVIPCHRVIGANGKLTGFGGGLPIKQWLLAHEGCWQGGPERQGSLSM